MKKLISFIITLVLIVGLGGFVAIKTHNDAQKELTYTLGGKTFAFAYETVRDDKQWREQEDKVPGQFVEMCGEGGLEGLKSRQGYRVCEIRVAENTFFKAAQSGSVYSTVMEMDKYTFNFGANNTYGTSGDRPEASLGLGYSIVFPTDDTAYVRINLGSYQSSGEEKSVYYFAVFKAE